MSSLLSVAEARALVRSPLTDALLQAVIDREEAEIVRRFGAHYVDATTAFTEYCEGGLSNLYLNRQIEDVTSVTERYFQPTETGAVLTEDTQFFAWKREGRLERLPVGSKWARFVTVAYVPLDDTSRRKNAIIDLLRLATQRTAMKGESIAGEYSYTAPEWEGERMDIYRSLGFLHL